ncbi:unnamed protein product [Rotaria socialis]|uniref:Uncharacterized protein n=2 Tax=Rotaria socialis TaxID=392032 RepID=A0A818F0Z0_9BILA|nr:unnamed protein product [Rotaria socialis]CAF3468515.1 unnamed protein product [Rotaria socialis]CAF4584576.1 unnamed protein product [Rotaria socialis]CAF4845407.1 unnamed protein product [Rotaria socialis]
MMEKTEQLHEKSSLLNDRLETFSLVWIRNEIDKIEQHQNHEQKLRTIINHLKIFDNIEQCQQYFQVISKEDRFVVIINDKLSREIVPMIHNLNQVSSIYVYCSEEKKHKKWSKDFSKIRAITNDFAEILIRIEVDQKIRMKIEEPLPIKSLNGDDENNLSITKLDISCINFQILIDILLRIRSNDEDINDLLHFCKKEYKGNKSHLTMIREFQHNYSANAALDWYIHRPFLQKILNKAFQLENIDILYVFRPFIRDICHQLRQKQYQSPVRTYKGQLMSKTKVNHLKKLMGKLISVNTLLLTSTDKPSVVHDLEETTPSNNMQKVLLEIDADPRADISIPFAQVNSNNDRDNDKDILFMVGSIFRLVSIFYDKEKRCIIRMTLCNDNEPDLKQIFENMRNEYGYGETNLLALGMILRDMGKFDLAEKYLFRMLKKLPLNDPLLDALYPSLGLVAKDKGDYDRCLHWYCKSLKNYMVTRPYDYLTIGDTYNTIGTVYHAYKCQYDKALNYFNKAVLLLKQFDAEMHPMMAKLYDSIGAVHEEQRNYSEALIYYQKSLNIKKKHLTNNHFDLIISYKNIAAAHGYLGSYDTAIEFYKKALEIQMKKFSLQHPDIALTYANMAAVYAAKNRSQQALTYWHKANDIFQTTLSPQHPLIVKIEEEIKNASSKITNNVSPKITNHVSIKKPGKKRVIVT